MTTEIEEEGGDIEQVAVVGLAGRYPESPDIGAFWRNLRDGQDCLRSFADEEMDELGIPAAYYRRENFINRGTKLPDAAGFDAAFFGYTPREASMMDPQARIFLETCYQALEHAGYDPYRYERAIGVFAGSNPNDYAALLGVADPSDSLTAFDQLIGSDKDFLATRVSHRLNLRGPALTLQTACSTSLVAVHLAVQSLLNYECSMALAGGVTANFRQGVGYFYQPGMILSPAGTCRAFDADAEGTTLGQGCGVALLKRLSDAIEDGDTIWAVVKATALNNDGSNKLSYTAPSEDGQTEVIALAHELAGVTSDSITYVETHGTGTKLGDPIEIAALSRAFAAGTDRRQYCAIGSAKTNFGHTDAAAGITGFLKTVLSLAHGEIPPSLHFTKPNPEIDFENSPFFVNQTLRPWEAGPYPRRAGVSAFGIGGTNAHVVLEEAPARPEVKVSDKKQLFLFSAKTAAAVDQRLADLATAFADRDAAGEAFDLADVAFTLRAGRPDFTQRRAVVVEDAKDIAATLKGDRDNAIVAGNATSSPPSLVWLYTGQGAQYPGMAKGLYRDEPAFAEAVDACSTLFREHLDLDIKTLIFADDGERATEQLQQTAITQPALFTIEYAAGRLLHSWGLAPAMVIGHSIGEYAAAVEAGVMGLKDAVRVVAERGRLMQAMAPGSMASIPLSADKLAPLLPLGVELAAENAPGLSVVSGETAAIEGFIAALDEKDIKAQPLLTSHAFHSAMMAEAEREFAGVMASVALSPPRLAMVSNVTGDWLTDQQATDPDFWASQIRKPVLFASCVQALCAKGGLAFIELGPGRALSTMVLKNDSFDKDRMSTASMIRHPRLDRDDQTFALETVGKLWTAGVEIDWEMFTEARAPRRVPLPPYPFERQEFWQPKQRHQLALPSFGQTDKPVQKRNDLDHWLYVPSYQRVPVQQQTVQRHDGLALVLAPATPDADLWLAELEMQLGPLKVVRPGRAFARDAQGVFEIHPDHDDQLDQVFAALNEDDVRIDLMIHGWLADAPEKVETIPALNRALALGVHTAHNLARAASRLAAKDGIRIEIVTTGAHHVLGNETVRPESAALLGPAKIIPLEYPGVEVRHIDLVTGLADADERAALNRELGAALTDPIIALRNGQRWRPTVVPLETTRNRNKIPLRQGGVYFIVGGLGGVGLSIGRYLAREYGATLALTSRNGLPERRDDMSAEQAQRLDLLEEIKGLSPNSQVYAVDAASEIDMDTTVTQIEADIGRIDGVIVAAGVVDQGGTIHRRSREVMEQSIASKVHGSLVLARLFKERQVDFILLSSSIAATLYHNRFAQVGYVTGNGYAETFALHARQQGLPMTTVAWDDWLSIGMSVRAAEDFGNTYGAEITLMDELNSFTPDEGVELVARALSVDEPTLIVSPTDLEARLREDVNVISPFLEQAIGEGGSEDKLADAASLDEHLQGIWCDILGFETIAPADDFFELGGDSLQAARMADRFSRSFGIDVSLNLLFDHPKLADMTQAIGGLLKANETVGTDATAPDLEAEIGILPIGPVQIRLSGRGSPNPHHFNVSALLKPGRKLEIAALEQALRLLVERHPALRTRMIEEDGKVVAQEVLPLDAAWSGIEQRGIETAGDDAARAEIGAICREVQEGLHLFEGPLFRAMLITDSAGEQRLFLTIHHMVSDRMSLFLILDALDRVYVQIEQGKDVELPPRSALFGNWIKALQSYASSEEGRNSAEAWLDWDWTTIKTLPIDRPLTAEANINANAQSVRLAIEGDVVARILRHEAGRADELIMIALGQALAAWSGADQALIESLNHGRRVIDINVARTVGCFLTYAPVLIDGHENRPLSEATSELRSRMERAWNFDTLRLYGEDEALRQRLNALPRAEVLYNFVGRRIDTEMGALFEVTDEDRGRDNAADGRRDHKIAILAEVVGDSVIELNLVYSTAIHEKATIEALANSVAARLEAMAAGG
ncbi:MAG: SDR family oxidoreductase [Geminicoccales bacterium]